MPRVWKKTKPRAGFSSRRGCLSKYIRNGIDARLYNLRTCISRVYCAETTYKRLLCSVKHMKMAATAFTELKNAREALRISLDLVHQLRPTVDGCPRYITWNTSDDPVHGFTRGRTYSITKESHSQVWRCINKYFPHSARTCEVSYDDVSLQN